MKRRSKEHPQEARPTWFCWRSAGRKSLVTWKCF